MTGFRSAVLMGHPAHFEIRGGANPHTRDAWGRRKSVDGERALGQWTALARALTARGAEVYVVPAVGGSPGMVFPANAGFLTRRGEAIPLAEKTFLLSRALPTREAERALFGDFLSRLGFNVDTTFSRRFEGEADLFQAGDVHLFTSGPLERQRFVPRWGWPPYRRVYGFRSDREALDLLKPHAGTPVIPLTLVRETHYHGDTCLCAFGPRREHLMAYLPALSPESQDRLRDHFRERLIPLGPEDGEGFSANSFQLDGDRPVLFMPHRATAALQAAVRERGVDVATADVSEFLEKGGGSVKCMVADLGPLPVEAPPAVAAFRRERLFRPA
ncbi:MAG: hypothetical protein IPP68_10415 [Elusimicrobia bacterium]|nr:hypothetical protein [Elusimicrobiota bacterium]